MSNELDKTVGLLHSFYTFLEEPGQEEYLDFFKKHIIDCQQFIVGLKKKIESLSEEDIETAPPEDGFVERINFPNMSPVMGNNKAYFSRRTEKYIFGITITNSEERETSIRAYIRSNKDEDTELPKDSDEYKKAMIIYDAAEYLGMFKPLLMMV